MKLKQRVGDFRVRELLAKDFLKEKGEYRIYRVTKRKLTSQEAAQFLAEAAGVEVGAVDMAGMKDRQGVTTQYMSIAQGRDVRIKDRELKIETAGFSDEALTSKHSDGNAFELNVRAVRRDERDRLRKNLPIVREGGYVNYFDEQRFGNLKHEQGWIARDLMRGKHEKALKAFLTARSPHDDPQRRRFKDSLSRSWGDWSACRDIAGKFGAHHSVFEHLGKNPEDFAGAFYYVSARLRLIHLYAYQSHLWNRAVADLLRDAVPAKERVVVDGIDGPLIGFGEKPPASLREVPTFRLPGVGLEDVTDAEQHRLLTDVLARQEMVPDDLRIDEVSGFHLKGEDRPLLVQPQHVRVRPPEPDPLNPGFSMIRVRFELPRGAYATLLVKRLFARSVGEAKAKPAGDERDAEFRPRRERQDRREGPGGYRGDRDDRRHSRGGHGRDRDDRRGSRGDYRERGDRQGARGGYGGGRDDRRDSRGGYGRGRDDRGGSRGGYGGGRDDRGDSRGGYRGRDDRQGSRGGYGGGRDDRRDSRGGYRGRDDRQGSRGGYGEGRDDRRDSRGGYRGRDDRQGSRGGYGGGRDDRRDSRGGYRGRDDRQGFRGGYGGGRDDRRDSRGDYRGRDDRQGSRGDYGRGRDDRRGSGGGYRGRDDRQGSRGGYGRGRDDRRDSRGGHGGGRDDRRDSRGSSGQGRDDRRGSYGGRGDRRHGGHRGGGGGSRGRGGRDGGGYGRDRGGSRDSHRRDDDRGGSAPRPRAGRDERAEGELAT